LLGFGFHFWASELFQHLWRLFSPVIKLDASSLFSVNSGRDDGLECFCKLLSIIFFKIV